MALTALASAQPPPEVKPSPDLKPTRETIGSLATHRLTVQVSQLAGFLTTGLLDTDPRTREASLLAISGRTGGVFMNPSPDRLAGWQAERPTLLGLRDRVVAALDDPDDHVRQAAILALAYLFFGLNGQRPDRRLGNDTVNVFSTAYRKESSRFNRGEIVKMVALSDNTSEAHQKFLLEALKDEHDASTSHLLNSRLLSRDTSETRGSSVVLAFDPREHVLDVVETANETRAEVETVSLV